MSEQGDIPVLTDLITKGRKLETPEIDPGDNTGKPQTARVGSKTPLAADPFSDNPALEQVVRRILDHHLDRAWHDIKLAIRRELNKS